MALDDLINVLPQHERQRLQQAIAAQRDLLAFYVEAYGQILTALQTVLRSATNQNVTKYQTYSLIRNSQVLTFVQERIETLNTDVGKLLESRVGNIADLVQAQVIRETRALGVTKPVIGVPNHRLIEKHLAQAASKIARWNKLMLRDLLKELRLGILKGENYRDLASRIASGKATPEGKATPIAKARSHMLANVRYAVVSAANASREEAYTEVANRHGFSIEKMWWSAIGTCCLSCAHLHGQIVPLSQDFNWQGLPIQPWKGRLPHPPLHPNCRCRIIPVTPDLLTALNQSQISRDRRSRIGAVSKQLKAKKAA